MVIMAILWGVTALNYYLIAYYMKYVPGNLYVNTTVSTVSELSAYATSGVIYSYVGGNKTFMVSFLIAALGGLLIAFIPADGYLIASFVFIAKFGIAISYNLVYVITASLFPTERSATAFGLCEMSAMLCSVMSPVLAELKGSTPMLFYSGTSILALISALFLRQKQKKQ